MTPPAPKGLWLKLARFLSNQEQACFTHAWCCRPTWEPRAGLDRLQSSPRAPCTSNHQQVVEASFQYIIFVPQKSCKKLSLSLFYRAATEYNDSNQGPHSS